MFSAIASVVLLPRVANAEGDYPTSLLGFVTSDMLLGIRHNSRGVQVVIFSDEGPEIVKDSNVMNLEALEKKYPSVAEQKRQKLEEFYAEHKDEKAQPADAVHEYWNCSGAAGAVVGGCGVTVNIPLVLSAILDEYGLPLEGAHGVAHWARVTENGLRLAEETRANVEVLRLFALFHDSRRINEGTDPDHGQRGADFAAELRGNMFDVSDHEFDLLYRACAGHTHERSHPDMTIQTCWDSDRLDLGRVGIIPHPSRLCTEAAKRREMILWADGRASSFVVPEFVSVDWDVELDRD